MKRKRGILINAFVLGNLFFLCCLSCDNEKNPADPPTLTTAEVIGITSNWAISGGNITNDGGAAIEERGVCWGTTNPPSVDDGTAKRGFGDGVFTCNFKGLKGNTTYYLSAYASNKDATGYGEVLSFTTPPTVTDADGNEYATVVIGTQTWMAENLIVTHYRNGDPIYYIAEGESWGETEEGGYCDYDLIGKLVKEYGFFYDGYAITDSRNIAPEGWHVPTDEDWTTLIDYLGGMDAAGEKLRETGYAYWLSGYDGVKFPEGTNLSGFSARGAGMHGDDHRGWEARFWTSTMVDENSIKWVCVDCVNSIFWSTSGMGGGMSVRLIKD
jgi:uncharacterized protein (TIGR02145 family)